MPCQPAAQSLATNLPTWLSQADLATTSTSQLLTLANQNNRPCSRPHLPLGQAVRHRLALLPRAHDPRLARLAGGNVGVVVQQVDSLEQQAGLQEPVLKITGQMRRWLAGHIHTLEQQAGLQEPAVLWSVVGSLLVCWAAWSGRCGASCNNHAFD